MKTIWKYDLEPACLIEMPIGAKVLSIHQQKGQICLWALVDPEADYEVRHFVFHGTGHHINEKGPLNFVGTAQFHEGEFMFHVFEVMRNQELATA